MNEAARVIVITALIAVCLAAVLFAVALSLVTPAQFDLQDYFLLSIPIGLLTYGLRLLFDVSPWRDIAESLRRIAPGSDEEGKDDT